MESAGVRVGARPLPGGAPREFDGGVGRFELAFGADRSHTTQDQAITARLDVRGTGNPPLLRAPGPAPALPARVGPPRPRDLAPPAAPGGGTARLGGLRPPGGERPPAPGGGSRRSR